MYSNLRNSIFLLLIISFVMGNAKAQNLSRYSDEAVAQRLEAALIGTDYSPSCCLDNRATIRSASYVDQGRVFWISDSSDPVVTRILFNRIARIYWENGNIIIRCDSSWRQKSCYDSPRFPGEYKSQFVLHGADDWLFELLVEMDIRH